MKKQLPLSLLWLFLVALLIISIGIGPIVYKDDASLTQEQLSQCFNSNALLFSAPLYNISRWHHRILKINETAYQIDFFGPFGSRSGSYQIHLPDGFSYRRIKKTNGRFTCEGELDYLGKQEVLLSFSRIGRLMLYLLRNCVYIASGRMNEQHTQQLSKTY